MEERGPLRLRDESHLVMPRHPERGSHARGLLAGVSVTLGLRVLAIGLGLASSVLLARMLGAAEAGVYILAFSIASMLAMAGRLGLDQVVVRSVAVHHSEGNWGGVNGTIATGLRVTAVGAGTLAILTWTTAGVWSETFLQLPALELPLKLLALAILPIAVSDLFSEALRGLGRLRDSQWIQFVNTRALLIVGLIVVGGSHGAVGVSSVMLVASVVTLTVAIWLWRRATNRTTPQPVAIRDLWGPSATLFLTSAISMTLERLPLFFLATWSGSAEVGVFGMALRAAGLLTLVLQAVDGAAAHRFATLHRFGDADQLAALAQKTTRVITWITVPPLVAVCFWHTRIMELFGPDFVSGGPVLAILALGQAAYSVTGPKSILLVMSGSENLRLRLIFLVAIVNLVLSLLLIPRWGIVGAATATALAWLFQSAVETIAVHRVLRIRLLSNPFRI